MTAIERWGEALPANAEERAALAVWALMSATTSPIRAVQQASAVAVA